MDCRKKKESCGKVSSVRGPRGGNLDSLTCCSGGKIYHRGVADRVVEERKISRGGGFPMAARGKKKRGFPKCSAVEENPKNSHLYDSAKRGGEIPCGRKRNKGDRPAVREGMREFTAWQKETKIPGEKKGVVRDYQGGGRKEGNDHLLWW